jgi:hypothetical protein
MDGQRILADNDHFLAWGSVLAVIEVSFVFLDLEKKLSSIKFALTFAVN